MDDRLRQMQDEMSRFEAEISGTEVIPPPPLPPLPPRPIIGAGTFGAVQQQLDASAIPPPPMRPPVPQINNGSGLPPIPLNVPSLPVPQRPHIGPPAPPTGFQVPPMMPMMPPMMFGNIPPPPPPPSMLIPTQVQRMRPPSMMGDMVNMGMPPGMFGPPPFMRPTLPPRPSRPQPMVLSSAPQLYKNKAKESEKKMELVDKIEKPEKPAKLARLEEQPSPAPEPVIPSTPTTTAYHSTGDVVPPTKSNKKEKKNKKTVRTSGGQVWEDPTLLDWPEDDFRLFCGDLGNDVTDELLIRTFSKYASFQRAKVVRDKRTNKSKGFGFLSFKDPTDFIKATKEMNGRYVGSRPIKLRKSTWRNRSLDVVRKKDKEKAALLSLLTQGAK